MDIEIPSSLQWVAYLAGSRWPRGSETKWWLTAGYLRAAAAALNGLTPDLARVRSETQAVLTGQTAQTADQQFVMLFDGSYAVPKLVDAYGALADSADTLGTKIRSDKLNIISTLGIAATSITWALANADWSFGASLAEIPTAEALAEMSIDELDSAALDEIEAELAASQEQTMVPRLVAGGAGEAPGPSLAGRLAGEGLVSAGIGVGQQLGIDGLLAAEGHPQGVDLGELVQTAFSMGVAGMAGGLVGHELGGVLEQVLGNDPSFAMRALKGGVLGLSSGVAANVAGTLAGGGDLSAGTFLGASFGLVDGSARGFERGASAHDSTESAVPPAVVETNPAGGEAGAEPATAAGRAAAGNEAGTSANTTPSPTPVEGGDHGTGSASSDGSAAGRTPAPGEVVGSGVGSAPLARVDAAGSSAGRVRVDGHSAQAGNARLVASSPEGALDRSLTSPAAGAGAVGDAARSAGEPSVSVPALAEAESVAGSVPHGAAADVGSAPAVSDRVVGAGLSSAAGDSRSGVAQSSAGGETAAGRAGMPAAQALDTAVVSADPGAEHAGSGPGLGGHVDEADGERVAPVVSGQRGGLALVAGRGDEPAGDREGARAAPGQSGKSRLVAGRANDAATNGARAGSGRRGGLQLIIGGRVDDAATEGARAASGEGAELHLVVAGHADEVVAADRPDVVRLSGVDHNPLAAAEAIGWAAGSEHAGSHDQAGAESHTDTLTDEPPEPLKNCVLASADELSQRYPDREFVIDAEPTREGVPAEELFKAANCAPEDHFVGYSEVADKMLEKNPDGSDKMPDGSSAIVASKWAEGGPREGAHVFLAEKDNGRVYFVDPKTGERLPWPPPWGEDEVEITAVGYLDEHGDPLRPLDETPSGSAPADKIGPAQGHPTQGGSDAPHRDLVNEALDRREPWVPAKKLKIQPGSPERAIAGARDNAAWSKGLSPDEPGLSADEADERRALMDALIEKHPNEIGNAWGIRETDSDKANRLALQRARTYADQLRSNGQRLNDEQQAFVTMVDRVEAGLREVDAAAERAGLPRPQLLALDPREFHGNGRAVISFGAEAYHAAKVSWHVGKVPIDQLGETLVRPVLDQPLAEGETRIVWIGDNTEPRTKAPVFVVKGMLEQHLGHAPPETAARNAFYSDSAAFRAAHDAWAETGEAEPFTSNVYALRPTSIAHEAGTTHANPLERADGDTGVVAHRGDSQYPENTLAAFKLALERGADGLECDVHLTKDGHLVVIHDMRVNRTSDGTGFINRMTLAELRAFDLGDGQRIPTLEELLELVKEQGRPVTLFIETKPTPVGWIRPGQLEHTLAAVLADHDMASPAAEQPRAVVTSFSRQSLLEVRRAAQQLDTDVTTAWNVFPLATVDQVSHALDLAQRDGISGIAHYVQTLKAIPEAVDLGAARGIPTIAGGDDGKTDVMYLRDLGVRWIMTDDPSRTRGWLERGSIDSDATPAHSAPTVDDQASRQDVDAIAHADPPTRTEDTNCGSGTVDFLATRHDREDFVLGEAATPDGVPARSVFEAVGSAAEFKTYDEVEQTLRGMDPGSSAVLTSSWAGDGGRRGGHAYVAVYDGHDVYLYDPHTKQLSGWPPHWGEDAVSRTAVGYLKPDGDAVDPLRDPAQLTDADEVGHVQGDGHTPTGTEHEGSSDDDAGQRWRHVPAGIDPTGRLAAHALTKWETRLTPEKVERLLKRQGNAADAVQRVQADARAWPTLTGEEQRALIDKHPEFIGNGIGFPTDARYEANSQTLERCRYFRDGLLSDQRRGTMLTDNQLAFVAHMGAVDTKLDNAAEAAREAGIDEPHLLNFDRHWRVGLCYGENPLEAERLSLVVNGEGRHSDSLSTAMIERLRSEDNREAWIDWSAPNHEDRSNAAAQRAGFGESPLYREVTAWTAARRASAPEGSHPELPQVHWISDSSMHPGLDPAKLRTPEGDMSIVGHRGARHDRPENTWASAKLALEQGADAVEGDTQMTRDGHLVDLHDGKVDRTSSGTGRIAKMRLDQADAFDYGAKHSSAKLGDAQGDTGLLTWEKLLRNVQDYPRPVKAVIELKHPNKFGAEVEQELVRLLQRLEMDSPTSAEDCRAVVISFWPDALRRVWQAAPHVPTVLLLDSREANFTANFAAAKWAHASAIGPHMLSLRARPDLVAKAADEGLGVLAHGMSKFSKGSAAAEGHAAEFCTSIGVDAVITNEPGLVAHVLRPGLADHAEGLRQPDETDGAATQHPPDSDVDTASAHRDPGERWRDVSRGIDPTGRKAAHALAEWDRPRSPKVIERLLNRDGNAAHAVQETQADARAWPRLTGEQQRALIDNQHWFIGNGTGFPTEARYEANSVTLELGRSIRDRLLSEELGGKVLADEELKFVANMGKVDEELRMATEAAREAGIAEPRIWALDRHWHLVLSGGDPVKAPSVALLADRHGQLPHVDDFPPAVLEQLRSAGQEHEAAWMAWSPPNREPISDTAARHVRLGESPLYRDFAELTAARRAWAPEGSDPTPPNVHWVSDRSSPLERDPAMLRSADGGMTVVGHRGTPLHRPELTWSGYKLALEHGAGAIEGDVRMTSDGHLVVMHDANVDRTATGEGRVASMTRTQADAFDFGAKHRSARLGDAQGHTGLVGWDELLGFVHDYPRPVKVFIETKPTKFGGAVEHELARLLNRFDMASPVSAEEARAFVISSDPFSLGRMRRIAPHVPTALIWGGGPEAFATAKRIGASALTINIAELRARPDLVEKAAEAGLGVICACRTSTFGETMRVDAEYCQSLGVPAITVNDPGMVVSWLQAGRAGDG